METFLFVASKVLASLFSPLLLLLATPIVLASRFKPAGRERWLKFACLAIAAAVGVLSMPCVSAALGSAWETRLTEPGEIAPAGRFDCVVVLGGTIDTASLNPWHYNFNESAERLLDAARLYRAGAAPRILVAGGSSLIHPGEKTEADLMKSFLIDIGIPESAILVESASRNTFENALFARKAMEETGMERMILVTSAFHMRRSAAIFRKAGFADLSTAPVATGMAFFPFTVDSGFSSVRYPDFLIPSAEGLKDSARILREMAGYAAYAMLGRL